MRLQRHEYICKNREFQQADFENFARGYRLRSRKNGFARRSKHRKDETTDAHDLITHDVLIPNPLSLKTAKNFNSLVVAAVLVI